MKQSNAMFTGILMLLALAGCDSNGNGGMATMPPLPTPPTDFTSFVKDQFAATSDPAEPTEVDGEDFAFSDNDDPAAYDELLQ